MFQTWRNAHALGLTLNSSAKTHFQCVQSLQVKISFYRIWMEFEFQVGLLASKCPCRTCRPSHGSYQVIVLFFVFVFYSCPLQKAMVQRKSGDITSCSIMYLPKSHFNSPNIFLMSIEFPPKQPSLMWQVKIRVQQSDESTSLRLSDTRCTFFAHCIRLFQ